jgi:hypothetical protein
LEKGRIENLLARNNGLRSDIGCVVGGTGDVGWRKNQQGAESASSIIFEQIYYAEIKKQIRGDKT